MKSVHWTRICVSVVLVGVAATCRAESEFVAGHHVFTAVDENRDNRELLTNVWYPVSPNATDGCERYKTVVWWLEISGIGLGLSGLFVGGQCDGARAKRGPLAVLAARV